MSWSRITNNCKKPLKWWYHKVLCELGWLIRNTDGFKMCYRHMVKCTELGYDLHGEPLDSILRFTIKLTEPLEKTNNSTKPKKTKGL